MIALPGYLYAEAWDGFVTMRRTIKAPLTPRAAKMILAELQRIKDAGHCPNAALDQSTMLCWRDVWPAKEKHLATTGVEASRTVLEDMDRARVAAQSQEAQEARRKVMASIRRGG